jgi:hypothetical protein
VRTGCGTDPARPGPGRPERQTTGGSAAPRVGPPGPAALRRTGGHASEEDLRRHRQRRQTQPGGDLPGELEGETGPGLALEGRGAQQERPNQEAALDVEAGDVEGGDERLAAGWRGEHPGARGGGPGAFAQHDRPGGEVADADGVAGQQQAEDPTGRPDDDAVDDPEGGADGGAAEVDRRSLARHDPETEGGLADGPSPPQRLEERRVAEDHEEDREERHDEQGRAAAGAGGQQRGDPEEHPPGVQADGESDQLEGYRDEGADDVRHEPGQKHGAEHRPHPAVREVPGTLDALDRPEPLVHDGGRRRHAHGHEEQSGQDQRHESEDLHHVDEDGRYW